MKVQICKSAVGMTCDQYGTILGYMVNSGMFICSSNGNPQKTWLVKPSSILSVELAEGVSFRVSLANPTVDDLPASPLRVT